MDKFNYLYTAAMALPSETESQKVLKSVYLTRAKALISSDHHARDLKFNSTKSCPRCNSFWSSGCKIASSGKPKVKCRNRRKCRRMVTKHYCYGTRAGRYTKLSRFLARKLCKQVTFTCGLCGHKELFYLKQKRRILQRKTVPSEATGEDTTVQGKKRKTRKKNKFAGLNENIMTALKDPKSKELTTKPINKKMKAKKKEKADNKPISKNGMLQLAQLLKSKEGNSSVNKLELMFK